LYLTKCNPGFSSFSAAPGLISRFSLFNSSSSYFHLLASDASSILVGGRDAVYNLSIADLSEHVDEVRKKN
jgi:hypothetical protein